MLALAFDPWPLWVAQWERPEVRGAALVSIAKGRVVHVSPAAKRAGVVRGMALTGAAAKVEDLEVVAADAPTLKSVWEDLLGELHGVTVRLEPFAQGRVLLELEHVEAKQVAEGYFARGGLADTAEHALLGALTAAEGRVREASADFCAQVPIYVLRGLGLSQESVTRLGWLGVGRLEQLASWRKAQVRAFLGAEAACIEPLLFGPHKRQVARYHAPVTLRETFAFDDPATEPHQLSPVLGLLAARLVSRLAGKVAGRLTLKAEGNGLQTSASRRAKGPLRDALSVARLAELALRDTGAQALGVEGVTLELSGLYRPSKQPGLWRVREAHDKAVAAVSERFPHALLRLEEVNPYALAFEHRFRLVRLTNGEEVGREIVAADGNGRDGPERRPVEGDAEGALAAGRARA